MKKKLILFATFLFMALFSTVNAWGFFGSNDKKEEPKPHSIPTKEVIANDLIGRSFTEGRDDGYFGVDWRWRVEDGEIYDLKILNTVKEDDFCSFILEIKFGNKTKRPPKYQGRLQVDYGLQNNRWVLEVVKSKGVEIVKTGRYTDNISTKIGDDGWGGVNQLKIKNNTDSSLIVGGAVRTGNGWRKFSVILKGMEIKGVGGTFGGGNVEDYEIHFVEAY
ncbi:hypothetical protein J5681_01455 [bacterium]|nr:hypothetical protein [bacterium]